MRDPSEVREGADGRAIARRFVPTQAEIEGRDNKMIRQEWWERRRWVLLALLTLGLLAALAAVHLGVA